MKILNKKIQAETLKRIGYYIILAFMSFCFVSAFSYKFSPLFNEYKTFDFSAFYIGGNALLHGKTPYLDFVDNKGPVLYLLYAIPNLFNNGILVYFLLQIITVFIALIFIGKIAKLFKVKQPLVLQILYLIVYSALTTYDEFSCVSFRGYGFTEDICAPLWIIAFYFSLKYIKGQYNHNTSNKQTVFTGVILSVFFWLCTLIRMNDGLVIAVLIAYFALSSLVKKEWKRFGLFCAAYAAGSAAVLTPIIIWLASKKAVGEWIYQTVLMNFSYSDVHGRGSRLKTLLMLFYADYGKILLTVGMVAFICVCIVIKSRKKNSLYYHIGLLTAADVGVNFIACSMVSSPFVHYLTGVMVPLFILIMITAVLINKNFEFKKLFNKNFFIIFLLCLSVVFSSYGSGSAFDNLLRIKNTTIAAVNGSLYKKTDFQSNIENILSVIPENEKDKVYIGEDAHQACAYGKIVPGKRIYISHYLFSKINESYKKEIQAYFTGSNMPKWAICSDTDNLGISEIIKRKYVLVSQGDVLSDDETYHLYVYKLKG